MACSRQRQQPVQAGRAARWYRRGSGIGRRVSTGRGERQQRGGPEAGRRCERGGRQRQRTIQAGRQVAEQAGRRQQCTANLQAE